jgi:hypothetical protein
MIERLRPVFPVPQDLVQEDQSFQFDSAQSMGQLLLLQVLASFKAEQGLPP